MMSYTIQCTITKLSSDGSLRDAVSNNKKVELLVSDDLKIESVSIIA